MALVAESLVVIVKRERTSYRDRFAPYKVILDDQVIGSVKNGEVVTFPIRPGPHRLRVKVFGKGSSELSVTVGDEGSPTFECGPAGSILSSLHRAFFRRGDYLTLRPAP